MAPLQTYPADLVVEILAKLPVKSLLRFRCVSKSCDITISDPVFSKLHQSRPCLFISKEKKAPFHFICLSNEALLADNCDGIDGAVTYLSVPWVTSADRFVFDVLGCCNGLVCVYSYSTVSTIWNPSTRKFKTLPPVMGFENKLHSTSGFGYDQVTDDYKVVKEFPTDAGDNVFVFSLKSDAWRRIPDSNICRPSFPSDTYGVLLGGALHWVAISGEVTIAFNLTKEKYEALPHPPEIGLSSTVISVLGEHLCLCSKPKYHNGNPVDVWIMKEYGVKSSWTKMFQVLHETLSRYCGGYHITPLLFSKEDEIVAIVRGTGVAVVKCNTRDLRFKDLMLLPNDHHDYSFLYRESLVSPLLSHQA